LLWMIKTTFTAETRRTQRLRREPLSEGSFLSLLLRETSARSAPLR
jgi:hypothetical protein